MNTLRSRWLRSGGRRVCVLLLAAGSLHSSVALASDVATAEALFDRGRTLLEAGDVANACEAFAGSLRLDRSSGTALNLARCHEQQGRTATAWAEYLVAASIAKTQNRDKIVEEANARAAEIAPKVSHLTVQIASPPEGTEVTVGDTLLEAALLGTKIPVDPGVVAVVVRAPHFEEHREEITVGPDGDAKVLSVGPLVPMKEEKPAPTPNVAATPTTEPSRSANGAPEPTGGEWKKPAAFISGGAGLAALGTGIAFGFLASAKNDDARTACGGQTTNCPHKSIELHNSSETLANVGNVVGGVGIVGLGLATYFFLTAPSSEHAPPAPTAFRISVPVGAQSAGLLLSGDFR